MDEDNTRVRLAVGDVNGDAEADLLAVNDGGAFLVTGPLIGWMDQPSAAVELDDSPSMSAGGMVDWDEDGFDDVLIADTSYDGVAASAGAVVVLFGGAL